MVASGMSNVAESPCRMALWIIMLTYPYMYHWQWQLWTEFITTHSDVHTCVCPCLATCMHTQKHTPTHTHTCESHTWRTTSTSTYVYIHMHADARAHTNTHTHAPQLHIINSWLSNIRIKWSRVSNSTINTVTQFSTQSHHNYPSSSTVNWFFVKTLSPSGSSMLVALTVAFPKGWSSISVNLT